jgi:hypothetical protein
MARPSEMAEFGPRVNGESSRSGDGDPYLPRHRSFEGRSNHGGSEQWYGGGNHGAEHERDGQDADRTRAIHFNPPAAPAALHGRDIWYGANNDRSDWPEQIV